MNPKCRFCQKETVYVPLTISARRTFKVYHCYDCSYEYVDELSWSNHHLYTSINNRMYRWSVDESGTAAHLWYVGEPGEPGVRANRKLFLVKSFKDFPSITPQNIERKLRFILLFL